jgi:hypothetical protein
MRARRHIPEIAAIALLCAGLAVPAIAAAEYYVPPGNSAANQYTESFPGAGGESGGKHKGVTPADALGAGNVKSLEDRGPAGKATAELAAATAPPQLSEGSGGGSAAGGTGGSNRGGSGGQPSSGSKDQSGSGGSDVGRASNASQPNGSSGLGQVVGQATGTGNGGLGIWLPLAIVLTLAGSIAYLARMRHGHAA